MKRNTFPPVSFIIPTLNAGKYLPLCLKAIRAQKYEQRDVEIVIADGGSTDDTVKIARRFGAKIINNPEVLHEPGKSRAARVATGEILFYTDSDNVLSTPNWILDMVKPYVENQGIKGFLPQTMPAPDSNGLDRYLGYLFTDPFTWFTYGTAANPKFFGKRYKPLKKTRDYALYRFPASDIPLFGLSQGVGTVKRFTRTGTSHADDLLAGINLVKNNGIVAYVPNAGVYHYHVSGVPNFIKKYTWRIRNNFRQRVKGMGLVNRLQYFPISRRFRMYLFVPYALSIVFPLLDAIRLSIRDRDTVMFWHVPASFILGFIIVTESIMYKIGGNATIGAYE